MERNHITIESATGVDVTLALAGVGTRSYAFVVDWHIRLVLAIAWFFLGGYLVLGHFLPGSDGADAMKRWLFIAFIPAWAMYLLYHPILEVAMRGRTPGKRIAGVRIVDERGGVPTTGALLIRNVFRLIDTLPGFYLVGFLTALLTTRRVRVGDLAAGTLLVHEQRESIGRLEVLGSVASAATHDPAVVDLALDLLARWKELSDDRRGVVALAVLRRLEPDTPAEQLVVLKVEALRERIRTTLHLEQAP